MSDTLYTTYDDMMNSGFTPVFDLQESWGEAPNELVRNSYDVFMDFTQTLIEAAASGQVMAIRDTEDLLAGRKTLLQVFKERDRSGLRVAALNTLLQESFLHTTATFPNAVASTIQRTLIKAWEICTTQWDQYIYRSQDRTSCEKQGSIEFNRLRKGVQTGKPIIEGGVTHSRWKFGENTRGGYCVHFHGDSAEWTWRLENCAKFNMLKVFLDGLTAGHNEGKIEYLIRLYAGANGVNPNVFNAENQNLMEGNPEFSRAALNTAIESLTERVDENGRPICGNRPLVLVTFSNVIANQASDLLATTEVRKQDENGDLLIQKGNGINGTFSIVRENWGKVVANGKLPDNATPYWKTAWFLFVAPQAGQRNAIEMSHFKGFATPKLFRKASNTQTIGGTPLQGHGDFDTMNREIKVMSGYGGQVQYPELMIASRGDGQA